MSNLSFKTNAKYDVISLGRIGIDLYAQQVNCSMEDITTFGKFIGGSPANITVGLATLGLKTGFLGRIADDAFAKFILKYFKEKVIDTSGIILDGSGAKTQIAISEILGPEASNVILYRDDNVVDLKISPDDISEEYIANAKILNISGTALAASPSREAVFVAMDYAIKHNVIIIMDVDYRAYNWKSETETAVYYKLAAEKCDVIIGTREEYNMIENLIDPNNNDDQKTACRLFESRAKIVLVKHGKDGSIGFTSTGEVIHGDLVPANVVNTFGAGDSYAASFMYGLLNGHSIKDSMDMGATASSIVISRNECSDAMPTAEEVVKRLTDHRQNQKRNGGK